MDRRLPAYGLALAVGSVAGGLWRLPPRALPARSGELLTQRGFAPAGRGGTRGHALPSGPAGGALEPIALDLVDAGELLRVDLVITSHHAGAARARYGYQLLERDRGPLGGPVFSEVIPLRSGSANQLRAEIAIPRPSNGFYRLRVLYSTVDAAGASAARELALRFIVDRGSFWAPDSLGEWNAGCVDP